MSTNRNTATWSRFRLRRPHAGGLLLAWAGLAWSPANATTEGETALINSPMPHEKLGAGRESVKVHWVRLQGYFDGTISLNELKADVQSCVRLAQAAGRKTRPPEVWPDHVESNQSDTYDTANRTITYATTLLYTLNQSDCSLVEKHRAVAKLASTRGSCEIDFINKTAHGVCDARAHADAPAVVHIVPQTSAPAGRSSAANAPAQAALAAMEKAMKQFGPTRTGEHKTIAGIECDVFTQAVGTNGMACISRGGSFAGWHAGPGASGASMDLELTAVGGVNARAAKAQLDTAVNAAVFAPYLADGFKVTNIMRRK